MNRKLERLLLLFLIVSLFGACTDSEDNGVNVESLYTSSLQPAFYMAIEDSLQPAWLQEMIKSCPYLKVYHSRKDGGYYLVGHPNRTQITCKLYDAKGVLQDITTQEALDGAIVADAPWTCIHIYSYPIVVGTAEWKALSIQERKERLQLPDNLLDNMRTEDLIEVCLDYPYALDYSAFDDYQTGFMALYKQFNGLRELLSRDDLAEPFLLRLDINWKKADLILEMIDTAPLKVGYYSSLSCMLFKLMLAQDAVINQMSHSQLRRMLDICIRNTDIEIAYPEIWSSSAHASTLFIYAKVIDNKGGFSFNDDKEKEMFNSFVKNPNRLLYTQILFYDDFCERIMKYVEDF